MSFLNSIGERVFLLSYWPIPGLSSFDWLNKLCRFISIYCFFKFIFCELKWKRLLSVACFVGIFFHIWLILSIALSTITCTSGQVYAKFSKKCGTSYASEESFEVWGGGVKLQTSPTFENNMPLRFPWAFRQAVYCV